jgi:hypothetical protein
MDRFTEYRRTPIVVGPLLENNAASVIARMITNVKFIAGHDEIHTILADLASESADSFKAKSNGGVVYRQGRMEDDGNWNYACILHLVRHSMAQYGHVRHLNAVFTRWPATAAESSNLSMQGDVIEYILYHLKFTGPAIEKRLRGAREALHASIRSFGDNMLRLMNLCGGKPIQYVIVARRPDPRLFTTFMLQAQNVHTANAESRCNDAAQFRRTFVTTQQNHWPFPERLLFQAPVRGASSSSSSSTAALPHPSGRASPCVSSTSSNKVALKAAPANAACTEACKDFGSAHLSESSASEEVCDVAWSGDLVGQYSWEICD